MRVVAVIQARMGSTRLPGKVLRDIDGETMLSRVVHRVRRATLLNDVVIATSVRPADEAVVAEATRLGVSVFRGSEDDVLDRYYQAALAYKAEVVVRITSDCPLVDPTIIDVVVRTFLRASPDYASNTLVRTYPRGLDVEVMSMPALAVAWREANKPYHRTHVTPYIYESPSLFRLLSIIGSTNYSCHRWTVDTLEDLEFVRRVYGQLDHNDSFGWQDVLNLCEREPALMELNRYTEQKPLEKS